MNGTEDRVRASIGVRWRPRPVPMPPGTVRSIRIRREVRRVATVAVVASVVVTAAFAGSSLGSQTHRPSDASTAPAPPPVWTYDDPSAWPAMALDPSASPDEGLSNPDSAHFIEARAIGTADGTPFALMTYVDNHDAVCGELEVGAIDNGWNSIDGPLCSSGWWVEIPRDRAMISVTDLETEGDRQRQVMFAIVSASTDHVVVKTLDGHRAELPVFIAEGSNVGFAFVFVRPGTEGTVRAIGAGGEELDSATLCFAATLIDGPDVSSGCTGTPQASSEREAAQLSGAR
jgi:hypothetical protein